MKKRMIAVLLTLFTLGVVLAACTKSSYASTLALSEVENLMVGMIKLDGTAQSITSNQATTLLPLWQAYQTLTNSSTASQTEKDALIWQISKTLTSQQLKAIEALKLTRNDLQSLLASTGFNPAFEATQVASTPSPALKSAASGSSNTNAGTGGPGGGSMPPGGDAGGIAIAPGGMDTMGIPSTNATPDTSAQATAQASQSDSSINPMIFNLIIRYLETKAGSS